MNPNKQRGGSRNDFLDYVDDYEFETQLQRQLEREANMEDDSTFDADGRL